MDIQNEGIYFMKKLFTLSVLVALIAGVPPTVRAAEAYKDKSAQAPKSENRPKQLPFRGKVGAVDKTAKTITLEGKEKSRTFQITSGTKITKDGKPAVLDDVTVGESVRGVAKENAAGKLEAVTLKVGALAGNAKPNDQKGEKH